MADIVLSTSADIQKIMSSLDRLERKTAETGRATQRLEKDSSLASRGLDKLGKAAAGMFAALGAREIARAAVEMFNLSAAAERAEVSLNAITGGGAAEYIHAISQASDGTINRLDAMAASNRALQLGVVQSADDMAKLTETARTLGQVMGMDTSAAMNDLVTGIGRLSPMILDNLGLTVKLSEVNAEAARLMERNAGMTEAQAQKLALLNQAAAQAAQIQSGLGDSVRTAADNMEWFQARTEDAKIALGDYIREGVNPAINAWREAAELQGQLSVETGLLVDNFDEFNNIMRENTQGAQLMTRWLGLEGAAARELGAIIDLGVNPAMFWMSEEVNRNTFEMIQAVQEANRLDGAYSYLAVEAQRLENAERNHTDALQELGAAMEEEVSEAEALAQAYVDGLISLEEYEAGKAELVSVTDQATAKAREEAAAMAEVAKAAEAAYTAQKNLLEFTRALAEDTEKYGGAISQSEAGFDNFIKFLEDSGLATQVSAEQIDNWALSYGALTPVQLEQKQLLGQLQQAMLDYDDTFTPDEWREAFDLVQGGQYAAAEAALAHEEQQARVVDKLTRLGTQAGTTADESEDAFERMGRSAEESAGRMRPAEQRLNSIANRVAWLRRNSDININVNTHGGGPAVPGDNITGRAAGGPVSAGGLYVVGERGPELFVPQTSGSIVPNHALGGGSTPVQINITQVMDGRRVGQMSVEGTLEALAQRGYRLEVA